MTDTSYSKSRPRGSYRGDRRPYAGDFQTLGVAPDASWEPVRQAYVDLVRVWHPDRFQSDPQLRDRAQERLQRINDAYQALKSSDIFGDPGEAAPDPAPPPPRPKPASEHPAEVRPRRRRGFAAWVLSLAFGRLMIIAAAIGIPLLSVGLLLNALRVPTLDSILTPGAVPRPAILMPSRMMDEFGGGTAGSSMLAAWARGEANDLLRSLPRIGDGAAGPAVNTTPPPAAEQAGSVPDAAADGARRRAAAPATPVMPVNGTEVLWTRAAGAGELWIANETGKDALATLVRSRTTEPLRAIYIQANSRVCVRNIAVGIDDVVAELGENWDPRKFRFRTGRQPLGRSGPFSFFEVASAAGSSGQRYEVALRLR